TVCPALAPPLYRTTRSCCSVSKSTIFPLASSPHCIPTTQVQGMETYLTSRASRGPERARVQYPKEKTPETEVHRLSRCYAQANQIFLAAELCGVKSKPDGRATICTGETRQRFPFAARCNSGLASAGKIYKIPCPTARPRGGGRHRPQGGTDCRSKPSGG